ncbi:hypothetical protein GUITHDRAFT_91106 [Guillardia theta CCMP2712]|uniref:alpha-1,3-mannosyl-glycoprotein 2-beta-N-acetylglucosaminyltransferase n=1 Tax=Guillardia theta (strain CCMP2712) TaxID=905079 RepID=L1I7S5_GUITC|nr:hypothetical protein GUITHDRAFT_91106 [Guillardia theta CCMP2712]EKX31954.1 hypothetical protein GUITHDRAFT_91106 [Guillardia theta CCMP2712]|eukprot:XP_005818934.1 hypothetical protein GUITHDRAFT_91106 [Guillardia theta CCMP2712]
MKSSKSRGFQGILVICIVVLLLLANLMWMKKVQSDQALHDAEKRIVDLSSKIKVLQGSLSTSQVEQETDHSRVKTLMMRINELESKMGFSGAKDTSSALQGSPNAPPPSIVKGSTAGRGESESERREKSNEVSASFPSSVQQSAGGEEAQVVPIIIFACCRAKYLDRTLSIVLERLPKQSKVKFDIIVSQDGNDPSVKSLMHTKYANIKFLEHMEQVDLSTAGPQEQASYYRIAQHYGWCFSKVFADQRYEWAIVLEDDLEVAVDFFEYMMAAAELLKKDPTLWTATAWNDNGFPSYSHDPHKLYRSDFFGGLGWLLTRKLWQELGPKWPKAYWDDWMREPKQRMGRACIRPQISRTVTFGKEGTSNGQFFDSHLSKMVLNSVHIAWTTKDISFLLKENYDEQLRRQVEEAPLVGLHDSRATGKIFYKDHPSFKVLAQSRTL